MKRVSEFESGRRKAVVIRGFGKQIADCRLQNFRFQIADSKVQIADFKLQISDLKSESEI